MKWKLDALKVLARNPTVPSVALLDAISEIEKLNRKVAAYQKTLRALRVAGDNMADQLQSNSLTVDCDAVKAWHKAQGE